MNIPYIVKEAMTTDQLRKIKSVATIVRDKDALLKELAKRYPRIKIERLKDTVDDMSGGAFAHLPATGKPIINIPRGEEDPVHALTHEFGHILGRLGRKDGRIQMRNEPGTFGRLQGVLQSIDKSRTPLEVEANRMGSRFLLATGSPVSEVKDYIRSMKKPIGTYTIGDRLDIISASLNARNMKTGRRILKLPDRAKGWWDTISGIWRSENTPEAYREQLNKRIKSYSDKLGVDLARTYPFSNISTPIDVTPRGAGMLRHKRIERKNFNRAMFRIGNMARSEK